MRSTYVLPLLDSYCSVLKVKKNNTIFAKFRKDYRYQAKKLLKMYEKIKLVLIEFHAFGECIPRIYTLYQDIDKEKNVLYVAFPFFNNNFNGELPNKRIFDVFDKKICFIKKENIHFWKFFFVNYFERIDMSDFFSYIERREGAYEIQLGKNEVKLSQKLEQEGIEKAKKLGIEDAFVCLHVRDKGVTKDWLNKTESGIREADVESYIKMSEILQKKQIMTIRMGKFEERRVSADSIVDYPFIGHDDLLDFYLLSKCKFTVGTNSGLSAIAPFFGKPLLYTNNVVFVTMSESIPYTQCDRYIPKKCYSTKKNKYLNLKEILDMDNFCMCYDTNYRVNGVVWEDNTEEEIAEAVMEMNSRIDGTWIETEEEKQCMEKYTMIMENWKNEHKSVNFRRRLRWRGYTMLPIPISYSYLKKNMYLLEEI